ncbi:response regulator transcription factor [Paenibacillus sp. IITD108]|uniref:response regulator transcription factor n=1 Tax=Paenibacillus sp. IITD108 TaxID=3116649 RepID=UPI002F422192
MSAKIKAIIVDDDQMTLQGLAKTIDWRRLNVEIAGLAIDGMEGLAMIEEHQPDLILTDIYMPRMDGIAMLQAARQAGSKAEVIILSGYEDFKYAKSALKLQVADYLSKPATVPEIEAVLQETIKKIKQSNQLEQEERELKELVNYHLPETKKQLLKGILEPHFCEKEFFGKATKQLGLNFANQAFAAAVLEYAVPIGKAHYKSKDLLTYTYAITNILEELVAKESSVYLADVQKDKFVLLFALPAHLRAETFKNRMKYTIQQFIAPIKSYLKLDVWVSLGPIEADVSLAWRSCRKAMNALIERASAEETWLVADEQSLNKLPASLPSKPIEHYQSLMEAVLEGNSDELTAHITQLLKTLNDLKAMNVHYIRSVVIDLMGMLTISLYQQGVLVEEIYPDVRWYQDLERINNAQDLELWLKETMALLCSAMASRVNHKHKKTVDYMKKYVKEHLDEDITLDVIADEVSLTRNYLSQIFKDVTGENYNGYVTRVRMERAKELMMSGKYKLYEITAMVGYKNNAYFSQQFKKHMGCNPSDYC